MQVYPLWGRIIRPYILNEQFWGIPARSSLNLIIFGRIIHTWRNNSRKGFDCGLTDVPKRKRNRLSDYDYSHAGCYFVTICVFPRKNVFWDAGEFARIQNAPPPDILGSGMIRPDNVPLSTAGKTVQTAIRSVSDHYDDVEIEHYCIMPDHVHLLIRFYGDLFGENACPPLSTVVGSLKRWVSKQIGHSIWQKSFYDHIIRSDKEHGKIVMYIEHNPLHWQIDHGDYSEWDC